MSIDNYDNILKKALQEVDKKKLNEAKDLFIKLTELDNKRYEGFLNLSNILVIENKQNEANNILQDYLTKTESHPEIVKGIAINLFNSNKITQLNSHLEKYIYEIQHAGISMVEGKYTFYDLVFRTPRYRNENLVFLSRITLFGKLGWALYHDDAAVDDEIYVFDDVKFHTLKSINKYNFCVKRSYLRACLPAI